MVVFTISTRKVSFENQSVAIGKRVLLCTYLHIVQRQIRTYSTDVCGVYTVYI